MFMAERNPRGVVSAIVLLFAYSWMMLCVGDGARARKRKRRE
jgi:hypothetical protein